MCGRFTLEIPPELLADIFGLSEVPQFQPRYNIAPTQTVPVVRQDAARGNRLDLLRWGLIPSWSKDPSMGNRMINARSESVNEKAAFRHAIRYRRCLVPSSGFIEWRSHGGRKCPYRIVMADGSPMVFAGLWESWKSPEGETLETFTVLTTAANGLVSQIHDRMPVVLHPAQYPIWLDVDLNDPERLKHLYQPFPPELMALHEISPLVNNPMNDHPGLLERVEASGPLPLVF